MFLVTQILLMFLYRNVFKIFGMSFPAFFFTTAVPYLIIISRGWDADGLAPGQRPFLGSAEGPRWGGRARRGSPWGEAPAEGP